MNHEKRADAVLLPTPGNATRGKVTLDVEHADGVQVSYNLSGMPPNSEHALQVRARRLHRINQPDAGPVGAAGGLSAQALELASRGRSRQYPRRSFQRTCWHRFHRSHPTSRSTACARVLSRAILLHRDASDFLRERAAQRRPRARVQGVIRQ